MGLRHSSNFTTRLWEDSGNYTGEAIFLPTIGNLIVNGRGFPILGSVPYCLNLSQTSKTIIIVSGTSVNGSFNIVNSYGYFRLRFLVWGRTSYRYKLVVGPFAGIYGHLIDGPGYFLYVGDSYFFFFICSVFCSRWG